MKNLKILWPPLLGMSGCLLLASGERAAYAEVDGCAVATGAGLCKKCHQESFLEQVELQTAGHPYVLAYVVNFKGGDCPLTLYNEQILKLLQERTPASNPPTQIKPIPNTGLPSAPGGSAPAKAGPPAAQDDQNGKQEIDTIMASDKRSVKLPDGNWYTLSDDGSVGKTDMARGRSEPVPCAENQSLCDEVLDQVGKKKAELAKNEDQGKPAQPAGQAPGDRPAENPGVSALSNHGAGAGGSPSGGASHGNSVVDNWVAQLKAQGGNPFPGSGFPSASGSGGGSQARAAGGVRYAEGRGAAPVTARPAGEDFESEGSFEGLRNVKKSRAIGEAKQMRSEAIRNSATGTENPNRMGPNSRTFGIDASHDRP